MKKSFNSWENKVSIKDDENLFLYTQGTVSSR